jgi:hypothetical protein
MNYLKSIEKILGSASCNALFTTILFYIFLVCFALKMIKREYVKYVIISPPVQTGNQWLDLSRLEIKHQIGGLHNLKRWLP